MAFRGKGLTLSASAISPAHKYGRVSHTIIGVIGTIDDIDGGWISRICGLSLKIHRVFLHGVFPSG